MCVIQRHLRILPAEGILSSIFNATFFCVCSLIPKPINFLLHRDRSCYLLKNEFIYTCNLITLFEICAKNIVLFLFIYHFNHFLISLSLPRSFPDDCLFLVTTHCQSLSHTNAMFPNTVRGYGD